MENKLYSVSEISELLGLHEKTVQRFIREGKIGAVKIGRAWKVSTEALKAYTHAELTELKPEVPDVRSEAAVSDRVRVSAVIELSEAGRAEASRISNTIIALLNCKDPSWGQTRFDFIHDPDTGTARFVLYGSPSFISSIMKMLEPLIGEQQDG